MTVTEPTTDTTDDGPEAAVDVVVETDDLVEDELLVEEISIDGMCGVY
jgi:mycofactocin precursor